MRILKLLRRRFNRSAGTVPRTQDLVPAADAAGTGDGWENILRAAVEAFDGPLPAEVLREAFHGFCETVEKPLLETKARIVRIEEELLDGMATIKALAPDLARRALDRTPLEVGFYIDSKET